MQEEAKAKIQKLIDKYEWVRKSRQISRYSEEETKKGFIEPLFEALGWNTRDKNEVSAEESLSSGRPDYGFYLDGRLKFYLEAKPLKTDLHSENFANQAVRYSWNKGATWAVLSDFESIIVFNAQDIESSLANKLVFEIPYSEYIERFDQLWMLSKEAFRKNLLDKDAELHGKKLQRVSIGALLYKDLDRCREILTHDLHQWNKEVDNELLDEGVQKILDRLIFLRVAEDRGIEPQTLLPLIRDWKSEGGKKHLYASMVEKFRELDEVYNSNLFSRHPFEKWQEYSWATEKVVKILEGKKGYYEYDFAAMPADVLGGVYENYLGYRLEKSKKGITVSKDAKKKKEHGIYYTPDFIVDYIVKNTLKPILDKCRTIADLKKIKVLDPACGSGSFLVKAFEIIYNKYIEFGNPGGVWTKVDILLSNIYGVDLDPQAVEIARLNLLINALDKRRKLPGLEKNIKNGNSLISGTDEELKKYFGATFRDKKPFNWQEEFPEVFKQGGFDVVIGNPPWVFTRGENFSDPEKKYFDKYLIDLKIIQPNKGKNIQSGKLNLYSLFLVKSLDLIKFNGLVGLIIPNNILRTTTFDIVRKFILDHAVIKQITDLGGSVFASVTASSVVLILNKNTTANSNNDVEIVSDVVDLQGNKFKKHLVKQSSFYQNESFAFNILSDTTSSALSRKIEQDSVKLGLFTEYILEGIVGSLERDVANEKIDSTYKPFLLGKDIGRYKIKYRGRWVRYDKSRLHRARPEKVFLSDKILLQRISGGDRPLVAALDKKHYYTFASLNNILLKENSGFSILYILGLINSRLMNWYYSINFSNKSKLTVNVSKTFLSQIPIKKCSLKDQKQIIDYVGQMLALNETLGKSEENSEKWKSMENQIERVDKKIDEEVYKLYGLTLKEVELIENGTK
jgi:adenine-specific DNA-methyltransferase